LGITVHQCAGLNISFGPVTAADATEMVQIIAKGRFVLGVSTDIHPAVSKIKTRRGSVLAVHGPDDPRLLAIVSGIVSGRVIPIMNVSIGVGPNLDSFLTSVVIKSVTEVLFAAIRKAHDNRGGLTCDASVGDGTVVRALQESGWASTQTVVGGRRRFVRIA
jgi:hypothetical protein